MWRPAAYRGRIRFVKVNVDESLEVAQKYVVEGVPTLLFFMGGKLANRRVGPATKADLAAALDQLLKAKDSMEQRGQDFRRC